MQPQAAKCRRERMRRRLYNTSVRTKLESQHPETRPKRNILIITHHVQYNVHISNQLLVVELEFAIFVFVCPNKHSEHVVPPFRYAGGLRRDLGFALDDLGANERHELLVGFFRFLQPVQVFV